MAMFITIVLAAALIALSVAAQGQHSAFAEAQMYAGSQAAIDHTPNPPSAIMACLSSAANGRLVSSHDVVFFDCSSSPGNDAWLNSCERFNARYSSNARPLCILKAREIVELSRH